MNYSHHVFISYRRQTQWTPWVRDHFRRILTAFLHQDLAPEVPNIFLDDQFEAGENWVLGLGEHLATSAVIVPLLSGDYFGSDYCVHEVDLVLGRQPGVENVIPVLLHKSDRIPREVGDLQFADFEKYRNPCLCRGSLLEQRFSEAIRPLSARIARAVRSAPPRDPRWVQEHQDRFTSIRRARRTGEAIPSPTQFTVPPAPPLVVLPRLGVRL